MNTVTAYAAIILTEDGDLELLLPDMDDDDLADGDLQLLTAVFMRATTDESWVMEQIEYLRRSADKTGEELH